MECLLPYLCMVTVPHVMVRLERRLDYRGVGLARFHCTSYLLQLTYSVVCDKMDDVLLQWLLYSVEHFCSSLSWFPLSFAQCVTSWECECHSTCT